MNFTEDGKYRLFLKKVSLITKEGGIFLRLNFRSYRIRLSSCNK